MERLTAAQVSYFATSVEMSSTESIPAGMEANAPAVTEAPANPATTGPDPAVLDQRTSSYRGAVDDSDRAVHGAEDVPNSQAPTTTLDRGGPNLAGPQPVQSQTMDPTMAFSEAAGTAYTLRVHGFENRQKGPLVNGAELWPEGKPRTVPGIRGLPRRTKVGTERDHADHAAAEIPQEWVGLKKAIEETMEVRSSTVPAV